MDPKTYEINRLCVLNDYLTQAINVLSCAQRIGLNGNIGLTHTTFGPNVFGLPVQGMGVDPRSVDFNVGLAHSPYGVPFTFGPSIGAWPTTEPGRFPTYVDPFVAQRGLSHSPAQWGGWNPYTAELARQRELQAILARQQYEAMCRI